MRQPLAVTVLVALTVVSCSQDSPTRTDESLAAIVGKVTVNGTPLEVFPIATVRQASASAPPVAPAACSFASTGLLPSIVAGRPGAMGLSQAGLTVTVVDQTSEGAANELLDERDTVLDSPDCKTLRYSYPNQTVEATVSESATGGAGLTRARVLVSRPTAASQQTTTSLLGRHGAVLVMVNSSRGASVADLEQTAQQVVAQL